MSSSASHTPTVAELQVGPFQGGRRWMMVGGGIGAVLTAITVIVALATGSRDAYYSYLAAFAYWALWVKPATGAWAYAQEGLATLKVSPGESLELLFTVDDQPAAPAA